MDGLELTGKDVTGAWGSTSCLGPAAEGVPTRPIIGWAGVVAVVIPLTILRAAGAVSHP
jgi:hypothetical protein